MYRRETLTDRTPAGADAAQAFVHKGWLIVMGQPGDVHNCDEMGCGSLSHVIVRQKLPDGARALTWPSDWGEPRREQP